MDKNIIKSIKDRPTIKLAGIDPQSGVNGDGIRAVYFSQGCPHHCKGCFNPETWKFNGGKIFYLDDLQEQLLSWGAVLDGVTFSGGDPLAQPGPFADFAHWIKKNTKLTIWVYTGYTWEEILKMCKTNKKLNQLIKAVDVIMDGKFENSKLVTKSKDPNKYPFRGSTNQRAINVQKTLNSKTGKIVLHKFKKA